MTLETIEQLNFRLNLEQLLEEFRDKMLEVYADYSDEYQFWGEAAATKVETDVAIRKFIEENCK